jgi:hypothetical protein
VDYRLERKIAVNYETQYNNLYKWCLNEYDESNNKLSADLVPWAWSFYFTGSTLKVVKSVSINSSTKSDDVVTSEVTQQTRIVGVLHSGFCRDAKNLIDDVRFSMFGTARSIKDFQLCICQAEDGQAEACELVAIPSYETEIDFSNEIQADFVSFEVTLNKDRFEELVRLLEHKLVDSLWLRVSSVLGVYSEWSPSISTHSAKILSKYHVIEGIDENNFKPKVNGRVGDFELNFTSICKLNLKQSALPVDFEKEFEDPVTNEWDEEIEEQAPTSNPDDERFKHSIALAVKLAGSLKTPLWCIFAVLVLLLMK